MFWNFDILLTNILSYLQLLFYTVSKFWLFPVKKYKSVNFFDNFYAAPFNFLSLKFKKSAKDFKIVEKGVFVLFILYWKI